MGEIIYGIHTIKQLIKYEPDRFQTLFVLKKKEFFPFIQILTSKGIVVKLVNRKYLNQKTNGAVHQGVVAYIKDSKSYKESDIPELISQLEKPLILILDGITDPHNLGACLRSANAAGVDMVIVPNIGSAKLNNPTVRKVACGAAENIPLIRVTNLVRTIKWLQTKNIWIIGTTEKSSYSLYECKMSNRMALVMGSEGKGLRRLTRESCDELISIPIINKNITSLNVSVATGICLFEAVRKRYNKF